LYFPFSCEFAKTQQSPKTVHQPRTPTQYPKGSQKELEEPPMDGEIRLLQPKCSFFLLSFLNC